jgi:anthranilate synthase component II
MTAINVTLVDNRDSFSFNLADAFLRAGCRLRSFRSSVRAADLIELADSGDDDLIVLSPGPGAPADAGSCLPLVDLARSRIPVLGICLGFQVLAAAAGGEVTPAARPVHGRASDLHHDGSGPLQGLASPLRVARYHSLCVRSLPPRFSVHARLDDMLMAAGDPVAGQYGLQFHPESILTPEGDALIANLLRLTREFHRERDHRAAV